MAKQNALESPDKMLEYLEYQSSIQPIDVNVWLYCILKIEATIRRTSDAKNVSLALQWVEVANYAHENLIRTQVGDRATMVYKYVLFRSRVREYISPITKIHLNDWASTISWLITGFSQFDYDDIKNKISSENMNRDISSLDYDTIVYLRTLRQWIASVDFLSKLEGVTLDTSLTKWLQFKGYLP